MVANLIVNGGFEDVAANSNLAFKDNTGKGIMRLALGDLMPYGWKVNQGPIRWRKQPNTLDDGSPGPMPESGSYFLDLTDDGSTVGIIQSAEWIATIPTRRHYLSLAIGTFDPQPGMGAPVVVRVTVFDAKAGTISRTDLRHDPDPSIPPVDRRWARYEVYFRAVSDQTGIAIERVENNAERDAKNLGSSRFVGIDDVRLTAATLTVLDVLRILRRWFVSAISRLTDLLTKP